MTVVVVVVTVVKTDNGKRRLRKSFFVLLVCPITGRKRFFFYLTQAQATVSAVVFLSMNSVTKKGLTGVALLGLFTAYYFTSEPDTSVPEYSSGDMSILTKIAQNVLSRAPSGPVSYHPFHYLKQQLRLLVAGIDVW